MQREQTRNTKSLAGPHFLEKHEIYRPRLDLEIVPERPRERKTLKNDVLFDATVEVTVLGEFFHRFPIDFSCVFRCVVSRIFRQFRKMGKCLKHRKWRYDLKIGTIETNKKHKQKQTR